MTAALFWLCAVVAVVAQVALVVATVRVSRPHRVDDVPAIAEGETGTIPNQRRGLEIVWAVVPALALAALLYYTWRAING
jgi:heme/copper-type cytochrome/quinol oxidase subunit 2